MTRPAELSEAADLSEWLELAAPATPLSATNWRRGAICAQVDPEMFFPEKGGSTRQAKRVCNGCPVQVFCLEEAIENDEGFGIWGSMSTRERRNERRRGHVRSV